jgi:hypothetical protein
VLANGTYLPNEMPAFPLKTGLFEDESINSKSAIVIGILLANTATFDPVGE